MDEEQLALLQKYIANVAISGSTLRNQGAPGVAQRARIFLAELDLNVFRHIAPHQYSKQLDKWTEDLRRLLPKNARNWGTARKALNVFMVQAFLNKYLSEKHGMEKFKDVLETPLDSQATAELRNRAGRGRLPRWGGIIGLKKENSDKYQEFASQVATGNKLSRACLDIILWRSKKGNRSDVKAKS